MSDAENLLTPSPTVGHTQNYNFGYRLINQENENANEFRGGRNSRRQSRTFGPAQSWPCRPCGLILGTSHILLGLCVIFFDVATNWITETVFAITAGICFVNSGIIGLIAARKLDRGSITLFIIFSMLSLGLCLVLIIECTAVMNHACPGEKISSDISEFISFQEKAQPTDSTACIQAVETRVRAGLLVLVLLEGVVGLISIYIGAKSLCGRYDSDFQNPASPYHALIYGDLEPPRPPKRIVQDVGREKTGGEGSGQRSYSKLLLEYLVQSSPANSRVLNTEWIRRLD